MGSTLKWDSWARMSKCRELSLYRGGPEFKFQGPNKEKYVGRAMDFCNPALRYRREKGQQFRVIFSQPGLHETHLKRKKPQWKTK